jgi:hypothetical protein
LASQLIRTAQTKQVQYLSGTGSDHTVDWDFFCTGEDKAVTGQRSPCPPAGSNRVLAIIIMAVITKPMEKISASMMRRECINTVSLCPHPGKAKSVFIVFEGSMTDTEVKINGKVAGAVHQGAFYRFKYDITDKLIAGKQNLLEVTVSKMSMMRA